MTDTAPTPTAVVTWLLPVKDGMPFLPETLASIAAQTYPHWRVMAWDNGSSDDSVAVLRAWIPARLPGTVVTGVPLGLAESLARMVTTAETALCARIDADDVNLPDRLARQVAFMAAHPEVAAVGGQMLLIDGDGRDLGPHGAFPLADSDIVGDMLDGPGMGHPTVLFRRDAVLAEGNYRPVGPVNVEDYDLWLRLAFAHRLANLDAPVLRYRVHARSSTVASAREGRLHSAVRARLVASGPPLFGCTPDELGRLAANRHPCALRPLARIARHLSARSALPRWSMLRSGPFLRAARTLVAPGDLLSRVALWALAKRPRLWARQMWHSLRTSA